MVAGGCFFLWEAIGKSDIFVGRGPDIEHSLADHYDWMMAGDAKLKNDDLVKRNHLGY